MIYSKKIHKQYKCLLPYPVSEKFLELLDAKEK